MNCKQIMMAIFQKSKEIIPKKLYHQNHPHISNNHQSLLSRNCQLVLPFNGGMKMSMNYYVKRKLSKQIQENRLQLILLVMTKIQRKKKSSSSFKVIMLLNRSDEYLTLEDPQLHAYLINTKKKCVEKVNQIQTKINLKNKDINQVLIVKFKSSDQNFQDIYENVRLKSQSSHQSSFKHNPKIQKLILTQIQKHKSGFFEGILKQQILSESQLVTFYLCLHLKKNETQINIESFLKSKMPNQSIYKQLKFDNKQPKVKIPSQKGAKTIFNEGINSISLSQMALLKFRR